MIWNRKKKKPPLAIRPKTEAEIAYEEAKQRIYELHLREEDLFYADEGGCDPTPEKESSEILQESGSGWVYGETAKGGFHAGDRVKVLDNNGLFLLGGVIREIQIEEPASRKIFKDNEKCTLFLTIDPEADRTLLKKAWLLIKEKAVGGISV